jgi:hypothetical protein
MPKLSKSQMIILIAMVASIAYGGYDWYGRLSKKRNIQPASAAQAQSLKTIMESAAPLGGQDAASKINAYIIRRAEMKWHGDPFYSGKIPLAEMFRGEAKTGAGTDKKPDIRYTGYMRAGNKQLAVLNGIEYETGEALEGQKYILKKILPAKVIIEDRRDGTVFEVFLQDFLAD